MILQSGQPPAYGEELLQRTKITVCLSVCLSVCVSCVCLSIGLIRDSTQDQLVCLSVCLSVLTDSAEEDGGVVSRKDRLKPHAIASSKPQFLASLLSHALRY